MCYTDEVIALYYLSGVKQLLNLYKETLLKSCDQTESFKFFRMPNEAYNDLIIKKRTITKACFF